MSTYRQQCWPIKNTYFAIKSAGPQQCRVERVRSIGCHDHLHLTKSIKAVHLIQQLATETAQSTPSQLHNTGQSCSQDPQLSRETD